MFSEGAVSDLPFEGFTAGLLGILCVSAVHLDGRGSTFTVFVVGAVYGFTVNVDFMTAAATFQAVGGVFTLFLETAAAGFAGHMRLISGDTDVTFGAETVVVIDAGNRGTFESGHAFFLLFRIYELFCPQKIKIYTVLHRKKMVEYRTRCGDSMIHR